MFKTGGSQQVSLCPQPKQCTILREIPENYHTFAVLDSPKMGNLVTLWTFNNAFNSWKSLTHSSPSCEIRSKVARTSSKRRRGQGKWLELGPTLASILCNCPLPNIVFVNLSKNWGEEAAMQNKRLRTRDNSYITHNIYIYTPSDAVSVYHFQITQKRVSTQDESLPIRVLFLPMILSHATRSIWSSRCWVFRKHSNKGARSMETQVKPHWYLDAEILLFFCGKSLGGRGTWRGWSCLESILPYFQRITLMPNH